MCSHKICRININKLKGISMKKIKTISAAIVIAFLVLSYTPAQAAVFPGRFASGDIYYYTFEGNVSNGRIGANRWNGVSSNVKLTEVSNPNVYNIILISSDYLNPPTAGLLGRTSLYWSQTPVTTSGTWNRVYCYQYKNLSWPSNRSKNNTISHEVGHALSIAHAPSSNSTAIMRSGFHDQASLGLYDIVSLRTKWGN